MVVDRYEWRDGISNSETAELLHGYRGVIAAEISNQENKDAGGFDAGS